MTQTVRSGLEHDLLNYFPNKPERCFATAQLWLLGKRVQDAYLLIVAHKAIAASREVLVVGAGQIQYSAYFDEQLQGIYEDIQAIRSGARQ